MKKLLSLCLALCMAFTLAAPAFADAPSAGQVLAPSGAMDAVYYNPTTGQDGNTGESGSPVATFAKALSLVEPGGTIYVNGQSEFLAGVTTLSLSLIHISWP